MMDPRDVTRLPHLARVTSILTCTCPPQLLPSSEHSKCEKHSSTMSHVWSLPTSQYEKGSWVIEIPFQTNRRFARATFHRFGCAPFPLRSSSSGDKNKKRNLKGKEPNKKVSAQVSYAEWLLLAIRHPFLGILELPFKKKDKPMNAEKVHEKQSKRMTLVVIQREWKSQIRLQHSSSSHKSLFRPSIPVYWSTMIRTTTLSQILAVYKIKFRLDSKRRNILPVL